MSCTLPRLRLPKAVLLAGAVALAPLPASAAEKVSLILDWFVNPDHAPIIVADELGYFEEAGLDLTIEAPADPNDPPKLIAAGRYDLAVTYQPQLHLQVDRGLPLVRIGTLVATPLNTILVLVDGPIRSIADLKGRKVGFSVGGFEEVVLGVALEKHGLSLQDVTLINVNWALSQSLIAGQVDAVVGGYRNFELNQMAIEGHEGHAFYVEEEGVPPYDELVIVANKDKLDRAAYRGFLTAVERGVQYLINHPEKSWEAFIRSHDDLDDELNRRAWADTLPRFALRPAALDVGRYERFAEFLKGREMIEEVLPVESYAVQLR